MNETPRSSFSMLSMDNSARVCAKGTKNTEEGKRQREQSFSTTSEAGSRVICMREDSFVSLGAGAIANSVRFRWLNRQKSMMGKMGLPRVSTYPAQARFKFGGGRMWRRAFRGINYRRHRGGEGKLHGLRSGCGYSSLPAQRGVGSFGRSAGLLRGNPHGGLSSE